MSTVGYNKMSQNAIAALSYLAERYENPETRVRSAQIAQARQLSQTLVAKVLTTLAQAGYVQGAPGPNGGYRLARDPSAISFHDVVSLFDRVEDAFPCPFGIDYCPNDNPCPLHDPILEMRESINTFLKKTHFGCFVKKTPPARATNRKQNR